MMQADAPRSLRAGWRVALLGLLLALLGTTAHAHSASTAYLDVATEDGATVVQWRVALRDLDVLLDLDADRDGQLRWREVSAARAALAVLATEALQLVRHGRRCGGGLVGEPEFVRQGELGYAVLTLRGDCAADALDYRMFAGIDPSHRGLLRTGGGAQALAPGERLALPAGPAPSARGFMRLLRQGVQHILGGADHLLFLVTLMLPAVVVRRAGGWAARADRRAALIEVAWIATAFTLAHSVTLALAAFDVVRVAPSIIEPLVAATVLAAALNNLWPVVTRRLGAVAFVFGLIHGFAFAEVLAPLQLPAGELARALWGFNLGVEAGQLLVVAASFALLALAARWRGYPRWVLQGGSAAVAVLALAWLVERVFGVALLAA